MQENRNWGTEPPKEEQTANATGNNYHIGYVKTLEALLYLQIFLIPLFIAVPLYKELGDDGALIAVLAYLVIAFLLWITLSYFVYLFDNIAHIAKNIDLIATKEEEKHHE